MHYVHALPTVTYIPVILVIRYSRAQAQQFSGFLSHRTNSKSNVHLITLYGNSLEPRLPRMGSRLSF